MHTSGFFGVNMTLFDIKVMSSAFSVPSHPHFQSNRDRKINQVVSYPVQHSKGEPAYDVPHRFFSRFSSRFLLYRLY
jgi:hypothetical protein